MLTTTARLLATRALRSQVPVSAQLSSRRSLVTATKPKLGGHNDHKVFHPPFDKRFTGGLIWGLTIVGLAIPVLSLKFQNKKHGFSK
mmetsp:Transcript_10902/g.13648  ORF Transcript_10902/g.13648 Transcript_10902/m.13648 type:complete len:87 (-) Transcript_10902:955-1215(-)